MTELKLMRGCAGSGKSFWVQDFMKTHRDWVVVSRDSIRFALFGKYWDVDEDFITKVEHQIISESLSAGKSVVSDNTNLTNRFANALAHLGYEHGATVTIQEVKAPLDVCKSRNASRSRVVPENVLERQFAMSQKTYRLPEPPQAVEPYVADHSLPKAVLCDMDGTLAINVTGRSPYDMTRVGEDQLDENLNSVLKAISASGVEVIFMSARDDSGRAATEEWLSKAGWDYHQLFMREEKDNRKDWVVKYELLDKHIIPHYRIVAAFDDRNQVVSAYRRRGINVYQVRDGNF